jgi:hypothetical protein
MEDHRFAAPVPVGLAAPQQVCADDVVTVAQNIRPDVDAFARDPFHGEAAAIDRRIDVFNKESAACCGTLDSLNCLVHGDAIDKEATSRSP